MSVSGISRSIFCGLCLAAVGAGAVAQTRSAADGIYTEAQAARGKTLYLDNCTACHGGTLQGGEDTPPLSGSGFLGKWGKLPVGILYGYINTRMPLGQPGSLGAQGNADITAYILSYNNLPAGQTELPPDAKALSGITMTKP
jgi:mono/diheme cytochrome c family protein